MNKIPHIKAAIFDLDGTLFDSVGLWHEIDDIFLAKRGFVPTEEYKRGIATLGFEASASYTIEFFGLNEQPETLLDEWSALARDAYANEIELLDGAEEYLRDCVKKGIGAAALTSLKREFAESCLRRNGVFDLLDFLVTSDDTGLRKSDPRIYVHTAKLLGAQPDECVVFDDIAEAIVTAKRAGMHTVAIKGRMYDESALNGYADIVAESWSDIPRLVPIGLRN